MKRYVIAAAILVATAAIAQAGPIESACNKSDRRASTRALCGCIQDVADATLTGADQRLAAKFFGDPHMAQEIRQSHKAAHEAFWQKYKLFGQTAETFCG